MDWIALMCVTRLINLRYSKYFLFVSILDRWYSYSSAIQTDLPPPCLFFRLDMKFQFCTSYVTLTKDSVPLLLSIHQPFNFLFSCLTQVARAVPFSRAGVYCEQKWKRETCQLSLTSPEQRWGSSQMGHGGFFPIQVVRQQSVKFRMCFIFSVPQPLLHAGYVEQISRWDFHTMRSGSFAIILNQEWQN